MSFALQEKVFRRFVRALGGKVTIYRRSYLRDGERDREELSVIGSWDGWLSGSPSVPDGVPVRTDSGEFILLLPADAGVQAGDCAEYLSKGEDKPVTFLVTGEPVRFPTHIEVKMKKKQIV